MQDPRTVHSDLTLARAFLGCFLLSIQITRLVLNVNVLCLYHG